jgi:hypothetical protein
VAGLAAEHGDLGVGEQIGREPAVDWGGDRPNGLAHDDDLGGVGVVLGEVAERRRAVDEAFVLDGQPGRVLSRDIAEVRVPGAGRHVDEAVVAERVVGPGEVEDSALLRRILAVDAPVIILLPAGAKAGERAGLGVKTGAAAVEKEHDLGRVPPALPEGELAAIGTLAVAARNDLLPLLIGGRGRGVRRSGRARTTVVAAARGNRGRQRGKQEKQRHERACIRPEQNHDEPPRPYFGPSLSSARRAWGTLTNGSTQRSY